MINNHVIEIDLASIDPITALDERVVAGLVESFSATTIQVAPIIVRPAETEGRFVVVSGAHRTEAAVRSGWAKINAVVIPFATEDDRQRAELIGLDENYVRRDLTPAERALNAQRRVELCRALGIVAKHGGDRRSAAAKAKSQGDNLIGATAMVAGSEGKSLPTGARSIRRGKLPKEVLERVKPHAHLNKGKEIDALVDLEPAQREEVLAAAEAGKKTKASTRLLQVQRDLREVALKAKQADLPDAQRYGVIYADPPWKWQPWGEEGMAKAAENAYPTMTLEDIQTMPVAAIAHDDAVLFLWARNDMLPQALATMELWGFEYRSSIIWSKPRMGTGYWVRTSHEQLLIGVRGNVPAPAPGKQVASVIEAPMGRHSEKPEEFARIIESYYPVLARVELFHRDNGKGARPGWTFWGNQASSPPPPGAAREEGQDGAPSADAIEPGRVRIPAQTAPPNADSSGGRRTPPGEAESREGMATPKPQTADQGPASLGAGSAVETATQATRPLPVAREITPDEKADLVRRGVISPLDAPLVPDVDPTRAPPAFNPYSRGPDVAKPKLPV